MFVYDFVEFQKAAVGVLPHVSKDDITPTIAGAFVDGSGMIGTDRYTIGFYDVHALSGGDSDGFILPREALEWVSKVQLKSLRNAKVIGSSTFEGSAYTVRLVRSGEHSVSVELFNRVRDVVERSQLFDVTVGNFPPVKRLLDDFKPGETGVVSLAGQHLEKVTRVASKVTGEKYIAIRFEHSKSENPSKPGPVRFQVGNLSGLIQPNLLLS